MKKQLLKIFTLLVLAFLLPVVCNAAEIMKKNLGVRNISFGSAGQSTAMLAFIDEKPHNLRYQISYKTEAGTVFFECDLAMDEITRVLKRKNGTGIAEKWRGDARYRLQAAAKGGSLNDTRKGKSPGTIKNF